MNVRSIKPCLDRTGWLARALAPDPLAPRILAPAARFLEVGEQSLRGNRRTRFPFGLDRGQRTRGRTFAGCSNADKIAIGNNNHVGDRSGSLEIDRSEACADRWGAKHASEPHARKLDVGRILVPPGDE